MDHMKRAALQKYVSAVWDQDVTDLLELKDGTFFLHVFDMLDQNGRDPIYHELNTTRERLLFLKDFLQDFYGTDVHIEQYLKFETIVDGENVSKAQAELEIAKIAVVLLGIGVLDRNGQCFMNAALQLPVEMQGHVLAMIQSVVVPDTTEVVLTERIEQVLKESYEPAQDLNASRPQTPVMWSADTKTVTPVHLQQIPKGDSDVRTPLRTNISLLNCSAQNISSPFKDIKSPSVLSPSPLVEFVQSPQLIQKGNPHSLQRPTIERKSRRSILYENSSPMAVLKQKDLELRRLREQLNAEMLLKEEVQLTLQDTVAECVQKDAEIAKLQARIRELHNLEESYTELQELKIKYCDVEKDLSQTQEKCLRLQSRKEDLEQENCNLADEIVKMQSEMTSISEDWQEVSILAERVSYLETKVKSQEEEMVMMRRLKSQWEEEKDTLENNLVISKELNKKLRQELEELQAKQADTEASGESMSIYLDLQIGELKCQLEEAQQEKEAIQTQLNLSKKDKDKLKEQIQWQEQHIAKVKEMNTSLSNALTIERDTNGKLKKRLDGYITKYWDIRLKLETSQQENDASTSEILVLKKALVDSESRLTQHAQKSKPTKYTDSTMHPLDDLSITGYDISDSSLNETVIHNPEYEKRDADRSATATSSNTNTSQSQMKHSSSSTVSLQSIQSVKEFLPGVLPNAMSCANEPDDPEYTWDQLRHLSIAENTQETQSPQKQNRFGNDKYRQSKRRTPVKRMPAAASQCDSPTKQRRSGGTVIYFPLDHNGPIYPPPKLTLQTRRTSGKFTPMAQAESTSIANIPNSPTSPKKLMASAVPSHRIKYTPAKRSSKKFQRTSRQKLIKFPDDKF